MDRSSKLNILPTNDLEVSTRRENDESSCTLEVEGSITLERKKPPPYMLFDSRLCAYRGEVYIILV